MILDVNYEELQALKAGADSVLADGEPTGVAVAAPPEERALVEALVPVLEGDLAIDTLARQREVETAIRAITERLRVDMDSRVLEYHPAHEGAVAAYFDYAHSRSVLHRVEELGAHMEALVELVTGAPATDEVARTFAFPD